MTYFLKSGSRYNVSTKAALDLHEKLPVGTYTIKFDQMAGVFYLEEIGNFEIKGKIYGDTKKTSERILNTFGDRPASTGVMLSGEKGSGKTLLAKMLSLDAQKQGVPTIVINQPWHGEVFNGFLQMIEQPTVIIFDEFEKVYDREDQEKMLTLLDGVYPSKKLFVITCNDKWRVNEHMRNRPGRIYYRLDYTGLDNDFIIEYCEDNLNDQSHIESICRLALMFGSFNFDMLKAMVEEMNRYNESPQQVMEILNTKPEFSESVTYDVTLNVDGGAVEEKLLMTPVWRGNPLSGTIAIEYVNPKQVKAPGDDVEWEETFFTPTDLNHVDPQTGKFQFVNKGGQKLWLTKVVDTKFNYAAF